MGERLINLNNLDKHNMQVKYNQSKHGFIVKVTLKIQTQYDIGIYLVIIIIIRKNLITTGKEEILN